MIRRRHPVATFDARGGRARYCDVGIVQMLLGSQGIVLAFPTRLDYQTVGGNVGCTFASDGVASPVGTPTPAGYGHWRSPPQTGIGASYWIRFDPVSGSGVTWQSVDAPATWHSLSVNRLMLVRAQSEFPLIDTATWRFRLATDSSGTVVVLDKNVVLTCTL